MDTKDMKITIGHLYPDLLNLYGRQRKYRMSDETMYLAWN